MDQNLQQQVDALERKLNQFIDQYNRNNSPTNQTFTKRVTIGGGLSLNGSSIGSSGDLMSVYGVAPIAQAGAIANPTSPGVVYSQAEAASMVNAFNNLRNAVRNFGITA